jgi:predicted acyltransferase
MTELSNKSERLVSLDALRGFDMFWIIGGNSIIIELSRLLHWNVLDWLSIQMEHAEWNGFHFYDIVFPLFLFLAGVSLPFSLQKRLDRNDSKMSIYRHLFKRLIILVLFGLLTRGLLFNPIGNIGFTSVLARIGIAWFVASLIFLNFSTRKIVIWFGAILLAYWGLLSLVPVPGFESGNLTLEGNLVGYIDRMLLPGKLNEGVFDSEGLLSTLPAISTALLGVLTGIFLRKSNNRLSSSWKGWALLIAGFVLLFIGWMWGWVFPINKKLWTSSFVLFAGGLSIIAFSLFYLIIDVWKFRKWAFPFVIIGMNSITIYMCQFGIISFTSMRDFFFLNIIKAFSNTFQPLIFAITYSFVAWLFLYFLYLKKIFLKI